MIGVFKKEKKRRFICEVEINNEIQECYVSSSSHLSPILNLINKKVLLKKNKGKNLRTQFTLQALWECNKKVLLNLNHVNDMVLEYLQKNYEPNTIKREYKIKNYKSDFYITNKNLVIEAKGLLSDNNIAILPFNSGERCIRQLKEIKKILKQGVNVDYYLVLLSNEINEISLNKMNKDFYKLFKSCLILGMKVKIFNLKWCKTDCYLNNTKNIIFKS